MTELIRSAKSGSDWKGNEVAAYNITIEYQDAATFFGTLNLPQPTVNKPAVLVLILLTKLMSVFVSSFI